jgi:hypothetical protein
MTEGQTERDIDTNLREHARVLGARGFFHEPLVWIGERTCLRSSRLKSLPGETQLAQGDVVILDVAPNFDGIPADVSLTASLGSNVAVARGLRALDELRAMVPAQVDSGLTSRELVRWVREWAADAGLELRQEGYLFHALAHRVYRTPNWPLASSSIGGLGLAAGIQLFGTALLSKLPGAGGRWPFWNDSRASQRRPGPGLWSFEPHILVDGIGVKWEELLVIDQAGTRWLEPDSPIAH